MEIYPVVRKSLAYANRAPRPHLHSNLWVSSPFSPSQYSMAYIFCFSSQGSGRRVGDKAPAGGASLQPTAGRWGTPEVPSGADMPGRQPVPLWQTLIRHTRARPTLVFPHIPHPLIQGWARGSSGVWTRRQHPRSGGRRQTWGA